MKMNMNCCRSNNFLEALIHNGRENQRIGTTILVRLIEFSGAVEFNLQSMSRRIIGSEKTIGYNQRVSLKLNEAILNLIMTVQGNLKNGINWLNNIMENWIKFEIRNSTEGIIREFDIRIPMTRGEMNNNFEILKKRFGKGLDRCQECMNNNQAGLLDLMNRMVKLDNFNTRMNENFDIFGLFIRNTIEGRFNLNEKGLNEILLVVNENIRCIVKIQMKVW
jgi:hypothetical protein